MLLLEVGVDARALGGDDDDLNAFLLYSNARNLAAATESSFGAVGDPVFLLGGMTSYGFLDLLASSLHCNDLESIEMRKQLNSYMLYASKCHAAALSSQTSNIDNRYLLSKAAQRWQSR